MKSISKKIISKVEEKNEKPGLGKCTVTKCQGKHVRSMILSELAEGRFKKTEEMKIRIMIHCNIYHEKYPNESKKVTKLPKSTFYDLLNEFRIPTPLQYKKMNKDNMDMVSESTEESTQNEVEINLKINGTYSNELYDNSTQPSSQPTYNQEYFENQYVDYNFEENNCFHLVSE
jgi:hypothetical protein